MESEGLPTTTTGAAYHVSSSFVEQKKRPATSKRRKAEEEEMAAIKKVCERARQIPEEQRCAIDRGTRLADIPFNSVIEVFEMTPVTTVHGAAGIMRCVIEESDGTRSETKVCVPERYANQRVPCLAVYKGTRRSEGKGVKHTANAYHVLAFGPVEEDMAKLRAEALHLRSRSASFLAHVYEVQTLKEFPAGTCFAYHAVRYVETDGLDGVQSVPVVSYETVVNGEESKGEVFIPTRLQQQLEQTPRGVLLYQGVHPTSSGDGRTYYRVSVFTHQGLSALLDRQVE